MTERATYEQMIELLTPVYMRVRETVHDSGKLQRQWGKARRACLRDNGWTEEEFYELMDAERKRKFEEFGTGSYVIPEANLPETQADVPEIPTSGAATLQAWDNLYTHKGDEMSYESRNRLHLFSRWDGDQCMVSCSDATTGQEYWAHGVTVTPNMRVVDAVRTARKAHYGK